MAPGDDGAGLPRRPVGSHETRRTARREPPAAGTRSAPLAAASLQAVLAPVLLLWARWLPCGDAGHLGGWVTAGSVGSGTIVGVTATYTIISRLRRDMYGRVARPSSKVAAAALLAGCLAAFLVSATVIAEVGLWNMDSG